MLVDFFVIVHVHNKILFISAWDIFFFSLSVLGECTQGILSKLRAIVSVQSKLCLVPKALTLEKGGYVRLTT